METRFDIKPIGRGRYYGFEVDGDNLVLLEDFTITHNCPNLQKALDVMMSNSESGAMRIGTIRVYGTGGTKGANWEAFSNCFIIPERMICFLWKISGMLIVDMLFVVSFSADMGL